jgi:hypothetical protein
MKTPPLPDGYRITVENRVYTYSVLDDTFYPMPTKGEYQRNMLAVYVSIAILVGFTIYGFFAQ